MASNSFGQIFKITTFGESHGPAIGVVIDGCPAGLEVSEAEIQRELDRRRPGQSTITTQRQESDKGEILSGVFEGKTTGHPITILIRNQDQRSQDYSNIKDAFRPGHADFTYAEKYGIRDYRGGGRSSGRETACRVAAGAIAKKYLAEFGVSITAYTLAVGDIYAQQRDFSVIEQNLVRAPDREQAERMIARIEEARKDGDSLGGIVEAVVQGCPIGLGDPIYDKLSAKLAYALMSIGTAKGIEIGDGFGITKLKGSEANDIFQMVDGQIRTRTNHCGGILGGISTGENIVLRLAIKPPSSIAKFQETIDSNKNPASIQVRGRHDPCICPRVVPVVEAMIAITLADSLLLFKAHQG